MPELVAEGRRMGPGRWEGIGWGSWGAAGPGVSVLQEEQREEAIWGCVWGWTCSAVVGAPGVFG